MKKLSILAVIAVVLIALGLYADNPHVPRGAVIVAQQNFVSDGTGVPWTTIFTPSTDGVYRLSIYTTLPSSSSSGFYAFARWADDYTSYLTNPDFYSSSSCGAGPYNPGYCTQTIFAKASVAIQIKTSDSPPSGSEVFVVVEQL
jgi:hypothetical protein